MPPAISGRGAPWAGATSAPESLAATARCSSSERSRLRVPLAGTPGTSTRKPSGPNLRSLIGSMTRTDCPGRRRRVCAGPRRQSNCGWVWQRNRGQSCGGNVAATSEVALRCCCAQCHNSHANADWGSRKRRCRAGQGWEAFCAGEMVALPARRVRQQSWRPPPPPLTPSAPEFPGTGTLCDGRQAVDSKARERHAGVPYGRVGCNGHLERGALGCP